MRSHQEDVHQQIGVEVSPLADPPTAGLAQISCSNISTCPTNPNLASLFFFQPLAQLISLQRMGTVLPSEYNKAFGGSP